VGEVRPLVVVCTGEGRLHGDLGAAPVPWWSVGKTVIAVCVLALVARGRLALDDPFEGRAYTLRQMLQHTSGLGSYTERPDYTQAIERNDEPWTDAEMLGRVRLDPFLFAPGQGWSYSNTGYFLLRRLIEATTGRDIDAALQELVFAPLGVTRTHVARDRADLAASAWKNAQAYHPHWVYQGLLIGPPEEAALFMHRLLGGALLPPNLHAAMQDYRTLAGVPPGRPWRSAGYGLGLMMPSAEHVGSAIGHTGQGPGSVAAVYRFPDLDPPRTVAAFAPTEDQSVVEAAVLEAAVR
jgi:CubicO group peptidase (beta-lactamase class C family)